MSEQIEQNKKEKRGIAKNPIAWLITALLIGGVGYWAVTSGVVNLNGLGMGESSSELVAKVNGESIERRLFDVRFTQTRQAYQAQGVTLADEDIAELRNRVLVDMIDERLLIQHARKQGITPDEQIVEQEYQGILSQFESEEQFAEQLDTQHITIEDIKTSIAEQVLLQELRDQRALEAAIVVTPEETREAYDQVVSEGAEVPPFEDVEAQIEESLRQQKIVETMEALAQELRLESSVEILL